MGLVDGELFIKVELKVTVKSFLGGLSVGL